MSVIISRRVLAETVDWMNRVGRPVTIAELAEHMRVGYNRAAEITRYGSRHNWFVVGRQHYGGRTTYRPATGTSASRPTAEPTTGAPTRTLPSAGMVIASFGVECEMDFLTRYHESGGEYSYSESRERPPRYASAGIGGWKEHADCTVGGEIISPVFTDLASFARSSDRQWSNWIGDNLDAARGDAVPYFVGHNPSGNHSISTHIHIGNVGRTLTRTEKCKIANYAIMEYPLAIAITANSPKRSYMSYRVGYENRTGSGTGFCRSMANEGNAISSPAHGCGHDEHYREISDSAMHGTVEFRAHDACLPQQSMAAIFLIKGLAEKAQGFTLGETEGDLNWETYKARRQNAASATGPLMSERRAYVNELVQKLGDLSLDDLPRSVKEILCLGLNMGIWPAQIYDAVTNGEAEAKWEWFSKLTVNSGEFLSEILQMESTTAVQKEYARAIANRVSFHFHKLSELGENMESNVFPTKAASAPRVPNESNFDSDSGQDVICGEPENGWFRLSRLSSDQREQAYTVLECENVDASGNSMSFSQMRRSPDLFWFRVENGDVVDAIVFGPRPTAPRAAPRAPTPMPMQTEVHGLVENGSWPWTCSTCHRRFNSHREHAEFAQISVIDSAEIREIQEMNEANGAN